MKIAARARLAAVSLWMVAAVLPAFSADTEITVAGKVVDENGAPIRDVRVSAFDASGSTPTTAGSDAAGAFSLQVTTTGTYRILAEHEGYFVFTESGVDIEPETSLEIQLTHIKELAESVDVNYSPPVIDPEQASD